MTIIENGVFISDEPCQEDMCQKYASFSHCIMDLLVEHANEVLFLDDASGRRWTGAQIREKMLNIATALIDQFDFKPETMVCICSDHSDYSCLLALGVICAGGVVCCAYPLDPYPELLYLSQKTDPRFFFCLSNNLSFAPKLEQDLGHEVVACLMDGEPDDSCDSFNHIKKLLDYDHRKSKSLNKVPVTFESLSEAVCFITMSSGTTGKPKAVPVSQKKCIEDTTFRRRNNRGLSFACPASLDYVSGRIAILGAIGTGYTAVILNGFEPKSFLEAVQKYKILFVYLGGAAFYKMITYEHLDQYDISSLRVIFPMGAKIIYLQELSKFLEKNAQIKEVRQGYGTSEFGACAMNYMKPSQYLEDCENCGQLMFGNKVKVVDTKTGELLGKNETGMLHVYSRNPFLGYYDASLRLNSPTGSPFLRDSTVFDKDGYYITGDLGYFNEKGELYVIGRQKELMSCRGAKKVLPQELEEVIEGHEVVSKVCVLGIPNKRELTLHCPRAFIIPKADYYTDEFQREFLEKQTKKQEEDKKEQTNENKENNNQNQKEQEHKQESNSTSTSEILEHKGEHHLCKLDKSFRRLIAEHLMEFVNERVGYEKQLTGGIVILDTIPTMRSNGKMNKTFLRSLSTDQVEMYGDRSG